MDETLRQLGELLLGSVPTVILLTLLFALYSAIVHKPLQRVLAERRSTPIWCRSATISTWRAACERQTENIVERKGHRTLNIGLASQDFGKPNDLRKFGVSENHSAGMRSRLVDCVQNSVKPSSSLVASLGNTTEKRTSGMLLIY